MKHDCQFFGELLEADQAAATADQHTMKGCVCAAEFRRQHAMQQLPAKVSSCAAAQKAFVNCIMLCYLLQ